jgi:hypothetical protein
LLVSLSCPGGNTRFLHSRSGFIKLARLALEVRNSCPNGGGAY